MALNKKNRLKKKHDFDEVLKKKKAVRGSFLFIKHGKNGLDTPRFSFVVSANVAKKAVERNKIRRILSEAARNKTRSLGGYDIIVFANNKITSVPKKDIADDLLRVLNKIEWKK